MNLQEQQDREAIRYTLSVYTNAGDRGALDELGSAFAEDAVAELSTQVLEGRENIVAGLAAAVRGDDGSLNAALTFLRHHLTTSRVEFDGPDAARGWTYVWVQTPIGLDHSGMYVDRFERRGDRWLIVHRRIKLDWIAPNSLVLDPSLLDD